MRAAAGAGGLGRARPGGGALSRVARVGQFLADAALSDARPGRPGPALAASGLGTSAAVLATAQGRLAAAGEWALNEKRIISRAGLDDAQAAFPDIGAIQALLALPPPEHWS